MPSFFRLCRSKYRPDDSTGAFLARGRWNPPTTHMLQLTLLGLPRGVGAHP